MSTCARCGSPCCGWNAYLQQVDHGQDEVGAFNLDTIRCRDRELANLRSLLRSVTGKLEEAAELLTGFDDYEPGGALRIGAGEQAKALIDSVLEVLA